MEVQHHTFLMSALEGSDCSALLLRSFIPGQINFCGGSYDERLTGFCSGSRSDVKQYLTCVGDRIPVPQLVCYSLFPPLYS